MKNPILIIIISLCFCCSNDKTNYDHTIKTSDSTLGDSLIEANFLMYADGLKIDSLTDQTKKFYIYDERNNKIVHLDAEELAEFQFDFFLPKLNAMLSKRNFQLDVQTADNFEASNEIFLNGEKIQLYTKDDLEKIDFWDKASRVFFKKLNSLLEKQNIQESFFLLYGGNDLCVLLLTNKQFDIIKEKYINEPKEIPYRP